MYSNLRRRALALTLPLLLAAAAPGHFALVIGNANYTGAPPLPACKASRTLLASRLREAGFQVTEAQDLSNGATGGALAGFAQLLQTHPGATALLYACAYATARNDRDFLLPIGSAKIAEADILADGIAARALLASLAGSGSALIALDLVRAPDLPPPAAKLATAEAANPAGIAEAIDTAPPSIATPLAATLAQSAAGAPDVTAMATALRSALPGLAALKPPAPPASPAQAAPPAAVPAPAPAASPSAPAMPDDAAMSEADRRRVQIALASLGYYDGKLDGIFGPDSRAAIRRYQHELGAPMTGRLTAAEASSLVTKIR